MRLKELLGVDKKRATLTSKLLYRGRRRKPGQNVAISWSGGKDSAYLLQLAKDRGLHVRQLFNIIDRATLLSISAPFNAAAVALQGDCLGIPMIQPRFGAVYKDDLYDLIRRLRDDGADSVGMGYIARRGQRDLMLELTNRLGVGVFEPLAGRSGGSLVAQALSAGIVAVIVGVDTSKIHKDWLGRVVDEKFIRYLKSCPGVEISGENNEYQTFVIDSPLFVRRIKIMKFSVFGLDRAVYMYPERFCAIAKKSHGCE